MIGSTWNALFITMAMGAGMFAQQAAHKVSAGSEDKQVGSLAGLELFCSAEGYYLAGRFQGSAGVIDLPGESPTSPRADDSPLLAESGVLPEAAAPLPEPIEPETESAIPPPKFAIAPPAEDVVQQEMAIETATAAQGPSQTVDTEQPLRDPIAPALAGGGMAEVLPPPAPDIPLSIPQDLFGKPAEAALPVAAPPATARPPLPSSIAAPGERTYRDAVPSPSGRYVSPSDLVRERAMARGEQLRQRVETRKWLGVSPLRPAIDSTPYTAVDEPQQLILIIPSTASRPRH